MEGDAQVSDLTWSRGRDRQVRGSTCLFQYQKTKAPPTTSIPVYPLREKENNTAQFHLLVHEPLIFPPKQNWYVWLTPADERFSQLCASVWITIVVAVSNSFLLTALSLHNSAKLAAGLGHPWYVVLRQHTSPEFPGLSYPTVCIDLRLDNNSITREPDTARSLGWARLCHRIGINLKCTC